MRRSELRGSATALIGGAMLAVSALLPWVGSGPGHSLRGADMMHRVATLDGDLAMFSGSRLLVLWYLVPASGSLLWVAIGVLGAQARTPRWLAAIAAAIGLVTVWLVQRAIGLEKLGSGAWIALIGALTVGVGALAARRR